MCVSAFVRSLTKFFRCSGMSQHQVCRSTLSATSDLIRVKRVQEIISISGTNDAMEPE